MKLKQIAAGITVCVAILIFQCYYTNRLSAQQASQTLISQQSSNFECIIPSIDYVNPTNANIEDIFRLRSDNRYKLMSYSENIEVLRSTNNNENSSYLEEEKRYLDSEILRVNDEIRNVYDSREVAEYINSNSDLNIPGSDELIAAAKPDEVQRYITRINLLPEGIYRQAILDFLNTKKYLLQDVDRVNLLLSNVQQVNTEINNLKQLRTSTIQCQERLDASARRMFDSLQDSKQHLENARLFRMLATGFFGVAIILVVLGFWQALSPKGANSADGEMIKSLFSDSDRGMQFVTLFLLVVAVILFGIMGILESKELSALLGGLSGYILGRSSNPPIESKESSKGDYQKDEHDQDTVAKAQTLPANRDVDDDASLSAPPVQDDTGNH